MPPSDKARVALASQNLLKVDLGWLSPKAAQWLRQSVGSLPTGFHAMQKKPVTKIITTKAGKIGFVLFPEGSVPGKGPTPDQVTAVLAAGNALKGKVALIIGISPWGAAGETAFIRSKKAGEVFGCILGSGEGIGFAHSLTEDPSVLWVRPDSQGRAVNVIELLELPTTGAKAEWLEGVTFRAEMDFLDDDRPDDPAMRGIVGAPPSSQ